MIARAGQAALDLLYPRRCPGCGAFGTAACGQCLAAMQSARGPGRCAHCAARWDGADNCPRCVHMQEVDGVRAAFEMQGVARKLVHAFKYRRARDLAPLLAGYMAPLPDGLSIDGYHAVPLHRSRQRDRGFNQARSLQTECGWPEAPGHLVRTRKTARQVGMHLGERRTNVSGAFAYTGPELDGLTIGLIDDVVTTGATVNECARVLKANGAREVYVFAFARASYQPGPADAPISD